MIKIYKKLPGDLSTRRAIHWFDEHEIPYKVIKYHQLSRSHLMTILSNSEKGFEEIIVSEKKSPHIYEALKEAPDFENLTIKEMIDFLLEHKDFLRTPIIFDDFRLLVGFNKENIRVFLPRLSLPKL